jgi:hypothetical protein
MSFIANLLLKRLLPRLLSKACPATVPRSGEAGKAVDCFTVSLGRGDEPGVLLMAVNAGRIEGLEWDGSRYSISKTLAFENVDTADLRVTHYVGLSEVNYLGVFAAARGVLLRLPYLSLSVQNAKTAASGWFFNRRTLTIKTRLEVLRKVVELHMNGATAVDSMDLMTAMYGYLWVGHPGRAAHQREIDAHLGMLKDTGELRFAPGSSHQYQPTGFALKALEEADEQDRRHRANSRLQWVLAVFAFFSVVMAAGQANLVKFPTWVDWSVTTKTGTGDGK